MAAAISIWAVIVAHRANGIAKKALPAKTPAIEVSKVARLRWRFTNIGDATLHEARLGDLRGGYLREEPPVAKTLKPGESLELSLAKNPSAPAIQLEIVGVEKRKNEEIFRSFDVAI